MTALFRSARRTRLAIICSWMTLSAFSLAHATPATSPAESMLVSVDEAAKIFDQSFSSSPIITAQSEPEKSLENCGNAQASAFADPWVSYRSVHYSTMNNLGPTQRVAVYADSDAAARAFHNLTESLAACVKTISARAQTAVPPTTEQGKITTSPPQPPAEEQKMPAQSNSEQLDQNGTPSAEAPVETMEEKKSPTVEFTVKDITSHSAQWDDYVGFSHVSGMPYHCFREAHQRGAVVIEVETCDLDNSGSLTSAMAQAMMARIPV